MRKTAYALGVAALFSTASIRSDAQFNIGAGLVASQYGSVGFYPAAQVRIGYDLKEGKSGIALGFNYSPVSHKENFNVPYRSATDFTSFTNVAYTEKIGIHNYFVRTFYRFGDPMADFRFGVFAGASVDLISIKYERGTTPSGFVAPTGSDAFENFNTSGPKVDFGLTADFRMGSGMLYTDLALGLPANQVGDNYIVNPTVVHVGLQIGYKIFFGGNGFSGGGRGQQRVPTVRF